MKLYDIISNLKFVGIKNYQDVEVDALTCASKEKTNNSIYFCIKGTKVDGHDYALDAISNGAVCLVVERYLDIKVTQILVEDVRRAMSYISSIFFGTYKSKMKFVGITGTNGKTTTTHILRELLLKMNKKVGLIGTEGIYINSLMLPAMLTTPDPINLHKVISEMESNGCEYCIMEVSAHAIALNKIDDIHYDVVGLSNITKDHLDFFLTMENYVKCKSSLFSSKHAKCGVINMDAKYSKEIAKNADISVLTFGENADLKIANINTSSSNSDFSLIYNEKPYTAHTNLVGKYNISNITMAVAVLMQLGYSINDILFALKNSQIFVPGRFNILDTDTDYKVVIDYAHTPDGIKNLLTAVKGLKMNKIITVFGCGGDRDKTKRSEMGEIATEMSDYVVVTSDNPRSENPELIIHDITKGLNKHNFTSITDRRSAIEYALNMAGRNDIVAILGKGAERYQEINGVKIYFSDYDVVDEYLARNLKKAVEQNK